jgi:aspartyl aminopeptidase
MTDKKQHRPQGYNLGKQVARSGDRAIIFIWCAGEELGSASILGATSILIREILREVTQGKGTVLEKRSGLLCQELF